MNDKESKVFKTKQDERNYVLLNELNTQPRTTYLAALKNQNKEMPDYRPPVAEHGKNERKATKNYSGFGFKKLETWNLELGTFLGYGRRKRNSEKNLSADGRG